MAVKTDPEGGGKSGDLVNMNGKKYNTLLHQCNFFCYRQPLPTLSKCRILSGAVILLIFFIISLNVINQTAFIYSNDYRRPVYNSRSRDLINAATNKWNIADNSHSLKTENSKANLTTPSHQPSAEYCTTIDGGALKVYFYT